jgi:hypothetical protein
LVALVKSEAQLCDGRLSGNRRAHQTGGVDLVARCLEDHAVGVSAERDEGGVRWFCGPGDSRFDPLGRPREVARWRVNRLGTAGVRDCAMRGRYSAGGTDDQGGQSFYLGREGRVARAAAAMTGHTARDADN